LCGEITITHASAAVSAVANNPPEIITTKNRNIRFTSPKLTGTPFLFNNVLFCAGRNGTDSGYGATVFSHRQLIELVSGYKVVAGKVAFL
jgi:hypothetical protein